MSLVSSGNEPVLSGGTSSGKHDMFSDTDGIARELQRFIFRNSQTKPVRDSFNYRRPAIDVECGFEVQELAST